MEFHFFGHNGVVSLFTNAKLTLPEMMAKFEEFGRPYKVWWVPLPSDRLFTYDEKTLAPQVKGAELLGVFNQPRTQKYVVQFVTETVTTYEVEAESEYDARYRADNADANDHNTDDVTLISRQTVSHRIDSVEEL